MRKTSLVLSAALLVCAGAASGDTLASDNTYAVITMPVKVGQNLFGTAVNPVESSDDAESFVLTDTVSLDTTDSVNLGPTEGATAAGAAMVARGEAFWYEAQAAGTLYQFGTAPADASYSVPVSTGFTMASNPYVGDAKLSGLGNFQANGFAFPNNNANFVYLWDADTQRYKYYFLNGAGRWIDRATGDDVTDSVALHSGEGFMVRPSKSFAETSIIFTPAAE